MAGRILAIDYGAKRMGIALSDVTGTIARPITVIDRTGADQGIAALKDLVSEYDVKKIIVGYPRTLAGTAGPQAAVVEEFIARLKKIMQLPIERFDERLSSKEARSRLALIGIRGRQAKQEIDKVAAALVLQSYLDRTARGST